MSKIQVYNSAQGYNLAAKEYDKKIDYLNSFENKQAIPLLGDIAGKKVLDVGAGTGRFTFMLREQRAEVTALDVSEKMLEEIGRKNKHIQTIVGDAENLPFKDGEFDVVTAAFLIVHLKNPTRFFDEVYRALKSDGLFLVTNINQKDPPKVKTKEGEVVIESFYHRPEQVREQLESLAFSIEKEVFVKEGETWVNQIILAKK